MGTKNKNLSEQELRQLIASIMEKRAVEAKEGQWVYKGKDRPRRSFTVGEKVEIAEKVISGQLDPYKVTDADNRPIHYATIQGWVNAYKLGRFAKADPDDKYAKSFRNSVRDGVPRNAKGGPASQDPVAMLMNALAQLVPDKVEPKKPKSMTRKAESKIATKTSK